MCTRLLALVCVDACHAWDRAPLGDVVAFHALHSSTKFGLCSIAAVQPTTMEIPVNRSFGPHRPIRLCGPRVAGDWSPTFADHQVRRPIIVSTDRFQPLAGPVDSMASTLLLRDEFGTETQTLNLGGVGKPFTHLPCAQIYYLLCVPVNRVPYVQLEYYRFVRRYHPAKRLRDGS